jgi:hypothetical protein
MPKPLRVLLPLLSIVSVAVPAYAQAPGPPQNLTQSVSGTTVTLNWTAPSTGGVPTGYVVEAAFAPGGAVIASLNIGGTTLVVPGVPLGTYFVRVRGQNGSGLGDPSNEVTVSVGGGTSCPAIPLPPVLRVRSVGQNATVTWASGAGCPSTSFSMFAGSAPGLSNIVVVNAGAQLGLSAVAPSGTYFVRVVGSNASGNTVSQELTVRVAPNAQTETIDPNQVARIPVQALRSGNYQASLVWDDPTINLDLYLATPGCASFPPTSCQLAASAAPTGTGEQVTAGIVVGQSYELWIGNMSSRTTAFTVVNVIDGTPAISAPSSTATLSAADPRQPQD